MLYSVNNLNNSPMSADLLYGSLKLAPVEIMWSNKFYLSFVLKFRRYLVAVLEKCQKGILPNIKIQLRVIPITTYKKKRMSQRIIKILKY